MKMHDYKRLRALLTAGIEDYDLLEAAYLQDVLDEQKQIEKKIVLKPSTKTKKSDKG